METIARDIGVRAICRPDIFSEVGLMGTNPPACMTGWLSDAWTAGWLHTRWKGRSTRQLVGIVRFDGSQFQSEAIVNMIRCHWNLRTWVLPSVSEMGYMFCCHGELWMKSGATRPRCCRVAARLALGILIHLVHIHWNQGLIHKGRLCSR